MQPRGSRRLRGLWERRSFWDWLKKPQKAPSVPAEPLQSVAGQAVEAGEELLDSTHGPILPGRRAGGHRAQPRAQPASGSCGVRNQGGIKDTGRRCMCPLEESANACQKRLKTEKWSRSLTAAEGRLGKAKSRACSSVLQASGHYTPPLPPPRHVFCGDNTKCNLCFSIKSHFCSG